MPTIDQRPTPQLSVSLLETVLNTPALTDRERMYVFNRVVGEYAAYAVLSHIEDVERHDDSLLNGDVPTSWRSIDDSTKHRYRDMLSILRDTKARRLDESIPLEWSWITVRAMQSLREAARSSDDSLVDLVGDQMQRSPQADAAWRTYTERVRMDGSRQKKQLPITTHDVDQYLKVTSSRIRGIYLAQTDPSTPYLNEFADAACRGEQASMYAALVDLGRTIDPEYEPSFSTRDDAQQSIVMTHTRPTPYEIIASLQNGTFKELSERTVMPEDDFDELMSDAMEIYMEGHGGDETLLEETTTFMDTAEREVGRPIVWRESEQRDVLREEQALRDQAVAVTSDPRVEPQAVDLDANGLPKLTQTDDVEHPSLLEDVAEGYAAGAAAAELADLEATGMFDEEDLEQVEESLDHGDVAAGRDALRRIEEEAEEAERDREQQIRDSRDELIRDEESPSL